MQGPPSCCKELGCDPRSAREPRRMLGREVLVGLGRDLKSCLCLGVRSW